GKLSEAQIKVVENIIKHPEEKLPAFLLNKRGDKKVGKDRHLVMSDLIFDTKQNIEFEKSLYTWRGFRHAYGQKVRGQCTRTSGRKGLTVGVIRSKTAKAAKAAEEKKKKE
ncbi:MAG: 30S ribosomal protein S13, partial [Candidatus Micrarchaeia archaeon]